LRQAERLPFQPAFQNHRTPGVELSRKCLGQLALEPVELFGGQPTHIAAIIDQCARRPSGVLQQRAVPVAGGVVGGDGLIRSRETARTIMIVSGMKILDVDEVGRGILIEQWDRQGLFAHLVSEGAGPAILARHNAHSFRPQGEQFDRTTSPILHYLNIAIAMQQQMRGERFEQRLPGAGCADQSRQPGIGRYQWCPANPLGNQPHSSLRHRIFKVRAADGTVIFIGCLAAANIGNKPRRGKAARKRHFPAPALEGGGE
jgi:hypothetical protein